MVHGFSLQPYSLDTIQYFDLNLPVRKLYAEKTAFSLDKCAFLLPGFEPFCFPPLYFKVFPFLNHIIIVGGFQIFRAYIMGIMQVFSEETQ